MDDIHEYFKSREARLRIISDVRCGKIPVFSEILPVSDSLLLELKIKAPFADGVRPEEIYKRKDTQTIVFKIHTGQHTLILKLYSLPAEATRKSDEDTILNHEIEIRYLKVFADLVQRAVCPHFALPVGHAILTETQMQGLFPKCKPKKPGNFMMILGECGDSTFNQLLRESPMTPYQVASIIFQVVLSLHIVHDIFPSFRHNDLHLSNVLIQNIDKKNLEQRLDSDKLYVKYTVHDKKYYVNISECPYRVLIWDMYYSSIDVPDAEKYNLKHLVPRKKQLFVSPSTQSTRSCQNQYFDLHKFFDSLEYVLKKDKKATQATPILWELINAVVPEQFKCMSKNLTHQDKTDMRLWEAKHVTPAEILKHPYFDVFSKPDKNRRLVKEYRHPSLRSND
jgi:hypothetical protein